ncbi:hypothetical protein CF65_02222 [Aggregatibacter actinomycetemcomitans HK1651]|nr:hypothetical protein CF65_02222 [Aggregatibacter actinomycetemcomitans HK1651]
MVFDGRIRVMIANNLKLQRYARFLKDENSTGVDIKVRSK